MWIFIKEWLIGKLGGIPISFLTDEELQRFYNRKMNEAMDRASKNVFKSK